MYFLEISGRKDGKVCVDNEVLLTEFDMNDDVLHIIFGYRYEWILFVDTKWVFLFWNI